MSLVLRIFSSGRSRNFLCCRGEFVALLAMMMMMMGDAGRFAVEGRKLFACLIVTGRVKVLRVALLDESRCRL